MGICCNGCYQYVIPNGIYRSIFIPNYVIGLYCNSQLLQTQLLLDLFVLNVIYYVFSQNICIKTCLFCNCESDNESIAQSGLK